METTGLTGGLFRIFDWISKLAYINLLWMFFTLVGFIVIGIAPSTVAMFSIVRKLVMGESDLPIFSTFWSIYKREFKKSNLLSFSLIFILGIMYVDWVLIHAMSGMLHYILLVCFIIISILLSVVLIYIFPVYVHFEGSIFHYYKSAILLGSSFPIRTIIMALAIATGILISIMFPGVALLFFGSGLSFVLMYFSYSIFATIKPKAN
ncbi:YesL family protein [Bacillus sp. PS06]|uniref:YesL family protein n=1 Tax=Bacillus sp. PS06 TaxID=2764176 RepID=UPI00177FC839|nr:DUF624 domain-containing protein [Bacillus sp. PS06]MBD8068648.1 DUF624 domain-containing protein [Bacillus sp. PS06]